jgi:EAL domain-containing protein (putative c-di-GMP-specific phosphodiesterase class I)
VLARTQLALQHSKRGGKNRVSTQDGGAGVSEFDALVSALQTGTSFRVVRQPILRLIDESIVGWEMLSRGPQGIFEMPRDFFRVALEHNILSRVDLQCLAACLRAAPDLPALSCCHINLFPSTLLEVPSERLLELFPRRPAGLRLCIEISEQQLIGEPSVLRGQVRALKAAGILVAIDDVGFGRSSLETLILLEPDLVKIDPKFTQGVARNTGRERSLRRLVAVVGAMGSELVAEGIETRDDLEILLEVGVPFGQGFLWGRPA